MFELFSDPETIPFIQQSSVSLPKLKHQIDRRVLKIMAMAARKGGRRGNKKIKQCNQTSHKQVQTEDFSSSFTLGQRLTFQDDILSPSIKFESNIEERQSFKVPNQRVLKKQNDKQNLDSLKVQERPLRQHRSQSILYQEPQFLKQAPERRTLNQFTFKRITFSRNQSSADLGDIKQIQESCEKPEIALTSLKGLMKYSCIEMRKNQPSSYSKNEKYLNYTDNAKSEINGRMSLQTELTQRSGSNCPHYSNQKKSLPYKPKQKQTESSIHQQKERLILSTSCIDKMKGEVDLLIPRRRKQFWDSKVRLNVLKKIEQRYSRQLYSS